VAAFLWIPGWMWRPLAGNGYQFWSGIGSDAGELTLITSIAAVAAMFWRHHNCHVQGCWRLSWHPHPDHGHPVCRIHHPEHRADMLARSRHE
jgi:hypothetical protein